MFPETELRQGIPYSMFHIFICSERPNVNVGIAGVYPQDVDSWATWLSPEGSLSSFDPELTTNHVLEAYVIRRTSSLHLLFSS